MFRRKSSGSHAPRERVSWNKTDFRTDSHAHVTLHVSVWVEIDKAKELGYGKFVTLHVSVWVEIHVFQLAHKIISSRSTWACELKSPTQIYLCHCYGHAPRERVSWNSWQQDKIQNISVTLHVSVWVEIKIFTIFTSAEMVTLHVSVWVEIKYYGSSCTCGIVTLHVSVWVEISSLPPTVWIFQSHAPRERVSWNAKKLENYQTSRVTLHVSVWVEMWHWLYCNRYWRSRSTWACELKFTR